MYKRALFIVMTIAYCIAMPAQSTAQQTGNSQDTFFLAKKKGLLGRLGKSISTFAPDEAPTKIENQFLKYKNKIIRSIHLVRLGFECSIYDTCDIKNNFGVRTANAFHKNSRDKVIRHNLFFKEYQRLYPYLVADNERYLRDLSYIQDARIVVGFAEGSMDSVDVVVLTKDVFSLGGKAKIDKTTRGRIEVSEENFAGTATRLFFGGLYDDERSPQKAYSAGITKRNIGGSFIDWTLGYTGYGEAVSNGKRQESSFITRWEKPMVTPYIPSTGSLEAGYYTTANAYEVDSIYKSQGRYNYYNIDGWMGYSLNSRRRLYANKEIKVHTFATIRGFNQHFFNIPLNSQGKSDYRFNNYLGALTSINIFKQSFYKTNYIYGFGRNEDVPEGFNLSLTSGWAKKQQLKRLYGGLDFNLTNFKNRGYYSNYTFKAGGFFNRKRFEDLNLLFNVESFTRLKKINATWYHRTFINTGIATQINPILNTPLFINNTYGLPYFNPENINADLRATAKFETVYYNNNKVLGFKFAPFAFADLSLLKPTKAGIGKSELYSAVGGGVRTRNENLVFGTIELKGYYFPRTNGDMKCWKVEVSTNIRFKYLSSFIKRPDFIDVNQ